VTRYSSSPSLPSPEQFECRKRQDGIFDVLSVHAKLRDGFLRSYGPSGSRLRLGQYSRCPARWAIRSAGGVNSLFDPSQLRAKVRNYSRYVQ